MNIRLFDKLRNVRVVLLVATRFEEGVLCYFVLVVAQVVRDLLLQKLLSIGYLRFFLTNANFILHALNW